MVTRHRSLSYLPTSTKNDTMSSEINIIGTKYFVPRVRGLFQASDLAYFLFLSQLINSSLAKIDYKDCFKVGLRRLMIKNPVLIGLHNKS